MGDRMIQLAGEDESKAGRTGGVGRSTVDRLIDYIDLLESENSQLRKELAVAKGDLTDDEVAETAQFMSEWLEENLPDPAQREMYILSYMDSSYIKEARERQGPGHAKAMAIAASRSMPNQNTQRSR